MFLYLLVNKSDNVESKEKINNQVEEEGENIDQGGIEE